MKRIHGLVTFTAAAVTLSFTWWAAAGPIAPGAGRPAPLAKQALNDEMLSVAGITRVRINVAELHHRLRKLEIDRAQVHEIFRQRLVDVGIEVDDDPDLPQLGLLLNAGFNHDNPEYLAVSIVIGVHQRVHVERLDQQMNVATMSFSKAALTENAKAGALETIERDIIAMVRQLSMIIDLASDKISAPGR